jgi:hypothetical protein
MKQKKEFKSQAEREKYMEERKAYKIFTENMRKHLMTTIFTTSTWRENEQYRNKNKQIGCIYCSPEQITKKIPLEDILFILEMNNDTNKIMGIGMVRNHAICGRYHVYANGNYNRYVYVGKHRISREEMTEDELKIMEAFDIFCFKGNRHMKRNQGLKSFPLNILYNCRNVVNLVDFISQMFKKRMNQTSQQSTVQIQQNEN